MPHHHANNTNLLDILNEAQLEKDNTLSEIERIRSEYKLSDTSLGTDQALYIYNGGTVPIVTKDNGDIVELKFIEKTLTANDWGGGWDVKIAFTDPLGNIYDERGELVVISDAGQEEIDTNARIDRLTNIREQRLKKYGRKRQGGILRYPMELLTEHADYLQIDIERYVHIGNKNYISDTGGNTRYVLGNRKTNRAGQTKRLTNKPLINAGTILLPIPSQLQDSNNVVYGESRMNGLAAAGISAAEAVVQGTGQFLSGENKLDLANLGQAFGGEETSDNLKRSVDQIIKGLGGGQGGMTALDTASDIMTKKAAAAAVNIFDANVTVNQLLARANGEILNPNMEMLFSDVTIRNFRFQFKMTSRNKKEAEQVKLIIRAFKRNMAPQAMGSTGEGNFFLRTPNVFKLRYRSGNKNHPFLNRFKQCFLSDMQTYYTGDGVYSTYEDGTPVSIRLELSFKEIQPIYDLDYDERPGSEAVGY